MRIYVWDCQILWARSAVLTEFPKNIFHKSVLNRDITPSYGARFIYGFYKENVWAIICALDYVKYKKGLDS